MSLSQAKVTAETVQPDHNIKKLGETLEEMIKNPQSTYAKAYARFMLENIAAREKTITLASLVNDIRINAKSSNSLSMDIEILKKIESFPLESDLKSTVTLTKKDCEQELKKREEEIKAKELAEQKAREEEKKKEEEKAKEEKVKEEKEKQAQELAEKAQADTPTTPTEGSSPSTAPTPPISFR